MMDKDKGFVGAAFDDFMRSFEAFKSENDARLERVERSATSQSPTMPATIYADAMSLRDWFAGQALAGLCVTNPDEHIIDGNKIASFSYEIADAMLRARTPQ